MQNSESNFGRLAAGAAKVEITQKESTATSDPLYASIDAAVVNDPLYVKALVIQQDKLTVAIITVDAVAVAEIGTIGNAYLSTVRAELENELGIRPEHTIFNASHCHGVICNDIEERTIQAVKKAWSHMVPVRVGAGVGHEERITENRRLKLKNGKETDIRRAYALPPDEDVAGVGPIDPEIGVLKLERYDGSLLAVVYNFACHPIQGVPCGGNTADITGFASSMIEECSDEGTVALFLQGCAGDVNPAFYKAVDRPRDAEPLGNMLGLSTIRALRDIRTAEGVVFHAIHEQLTLPLAELEPNIEAVRKRVQELASSFTATPLDLRTFLLLMVKYNLFSDFPSDHSHRYLHEELIGIDHLSRLDAENRKHLQQYLHNIHSMEELTRVQLNLELLRMHQEKKLAAGKNTVDVEVMGLRIGDFVLVTFPGELSVEIGLKIKRSSPHKHTFVSGVTNGYIYYTPTAAQMENRGGAQEDSDCILAPAWQALFEDKVSEILTNL